MAYTPQTWADNNPSYPLSAARMNYIEAGIAAAGSGVNPGSTTFPTSPDLTADGSANASEYSFPLLATWSSDSHWGGYDHAVVPAAGRIQIIRSEWTSSGFMARVESRKGEAATGDVGVDRVEMAATGAGPAATPGWRVGSDMWWSTSIMLDPGFVAPLVSGTPGWFLVHQFFAQNFASGVPGTSGGNPTVALELSGSTGFLLSFRSGSKASSVAVHPYYYAWLLGSQPTELGIPHDFLFHLNYSTGTDGVFQAWYRKRGNQFPTVPQINAYLGQSITAPTDGSTAGSVGNGPTTFAGVTATTVAGENLAYYPETGTYRQRPDASPSTTVIYNGGLVGRHTRSEAEAFWVIDQPGVARTAAPTTGTWIQGARVWNSAPAAGGNMGWVCTTPGTPGTWKQFGVIEV